MKSTTVLMLIGLIPIGPYAHAVPVKWDDNDHYYDLIDQSLVWSDAEALAESLTYAGYKGHLVTINSAEENLWLTSTFGGNLTNPFHWIGAYQLDGSLLDQGWAWITGEPWTFQNWANGEPNNFWGNEDAIHFWVDIDANGQTWADTLSSFSFPSLVEYEPAQLIPTPSTLLLFSPMLAALAGLQKRRKRSSIEFCVLTAA